jgi:glutaminyl-peptide cyclotransferase
MLMLAFAPWACAQPLRAPTAPCERSWSLVRTIPHQPTHFTQGLLLSEGRLYESTGGYGASALFEKDPVDGRILRQQRLPDAVFGEGLTRVGDRLLQLSWREQWVHVWTLNLEPLGTLRYPGEGWGLTTLRTPDGERLVLSDGTAQLRVLHPEDLTEQRRITVHAGTRSLAQLNELEMVRGELLANIWHSDEVAVIDPQSGAVRAWFDFSPLRARLAWPQERPRETDLNGLAWDEARSRLLVTGKLWPAMFEVSLGGCAANTP